ncbi:MAG: SprB repeat-containing protein [Chitinophagaceae bacterium]|uniref:hypothetical protein n=1 Tax=unclassified Paraflavitalea TaxID=2798305 RepID=UPI003D33CFE3|nr:SprB repeat-containing protein [Chitinophagaceae bacterium]
MKRTLFRISIIVVIGGLLVFSACSKGGGDGTTGSSCTGVTIGVDATITDSDAGSATGSIKVTAAGGSGTFTYSINGGTFQTSSTFASLAKGTYTVVAKDAKGCTGSGSFTVGEKNNCTGVNIVVTATGTSSDPCTASGTIAVTASGSTGLTYKLDAGAFQAGANFSSVAVGSHTITVKDAAGCTNSTTITIGTLSAGALFTAAKAVIQTNCAVSGCHSGGTPTGGLNFTNDCTIVLNKDRIKARAIDANPSIMPPSGSLPQVDKDKIVAWITAGGRYTD